MTTQLLRSYGLFELERLQHHFCYNNGRQLSKSCFCTCISIHYCNIVTTWNVNKTFLSHNEWKLLGIRINDPLHINFGPPALKKLLIGQLHYLFKCGQCQFSACGYKQNSVEMFNPSYKMNSGSVLRIVGTSASERCGLTPWLHVYKQSQQSKGMLIGLKKKWRCNLGLQDFLGPSYADSNIIRLTEHVIQQFFFLNTNCKRSKLVIIIIKTVTYNVPQQL